MHGGFLLYRPLTLWVTPPRLHSAASRLCHYNMRFQRMGTISRRHFVSPIPICIFDAWGLPLVSPPHLMGNAPSFTLGGKSIVPLQYAFSTHGHNLSAAFRQPHSNMHLRCMGASSCIAPSPSFGGISSAPFQYASSMHGGFLILPVLPYRRLSSDTA